MSGILIPLYFSSFIFFSMEKHKEIKLELARHGDTTKVRKIAFALFKIEMALMAHIVWLARKTANITKMVSDAWRVLSPEERSTYDEMAREDKDRYEREKANYQGPVGGAGSRKLKDPNAPKRPMSAYLNFANSRRAEVKAQNPDCSNGEISKLLSQMWKEAPESVKKKYRDDEAQLWATYKVGVQEYRKKNDGRKKGAKTLEAVLIAAGPKKKRGNKNLKRNIEDEEEEIPSSGGVDLINAQIRQGSSLESLGNPNQDEMMAASALRGVRGGPNFPFGAGSVMMNSTSGGTERLQQAPAGPVNGGGGFGSVLGISGMSNMNSISGMNPFGGVCGGSSMSSQGGFTPDIANSRAVLEMGFPYQQYGNNLGNSRIMAQALRGASGQFNNHVLGLGGKFTLR